MKTFFYILPMIFLLSCTTPRVVQSSVVVTCGGDQPKVEVKTESSDKTSLWDFLISGLGIAQLF